MEISLFIGILAVCILFGFSMAVLENKWDKKSNQKNLLSILALLGIQDTEQNITESGLHYHWKGIVQNLPMEIEVFSSHRVYYQYLTFMIPMITKKNFVIKNITFTPDRTKDENFQESNQICLSIIRDSQLRARVEALLQDQRFAWIRTRRAEWAGKYVEVPRYDENRNLADIQGDKMFDVISLTLVRAENEQNRKPGQDYTPEFLFEIVEILYQLRNAID